MRSDSGNEKRNPGAFLLYEEGGMKETRSLDMMLDILYSLDNNNDKIDKIR